MSKHYDPIMCMMVEDNVKVRDADPREVKALEEVKKLYNNIQRSDDALHDFMVIKQTANTVKDPKIKAEIMKYVNSMASKLKGLTHDQRTVDAYPQLRKINTPLGTSYRVDSASGSDWIQIDGHADGKFDVTIWGEYKRPSMSPTVKKTGMDEKSAILLAKSYMSNANVHDNKVIDKAIKACDEESYFELMRPKKYKIFGDIVLLKSLTGSTATYTTSNGQTVRIGRRKWDELARKITKDEENIIFRNR